MPVEDGPQKRVKALYVRLSCNKRSERPLLNVLRVSKPRICTGEEFQSESSSVGKGRERENSHLLLGSSNAGEARLARDTPRDSHARVHRDSDESKPADACKFVLARALYILLPLTRVFHDGSAHTLDFTRTSRSISSIPVPSLFSTCCRCYWNGARNVRIQARTHAHG